MSSISSSSSSSYRAMPPDGIPEGLDPSTVRPLPGTATEDSSGETARKALRNALYPEISPEEKSRRITELEKLSRNPACSTLKFLSEVAKTILILGCPLSG